MKKTATLINKAAKVSVIVPVRNERLNLEDLIVRLHSTFTTAKKNYEIIAIDDYSTDGSYSFLKKLALIYPMQVYRKRGLIGKGTSIVEGIARTKGDTIVIIDADLSYPPEEIISMMRQLSKADIVVGNRVYMNGERKIKKIFAKASQLLLGRIVFGLDFDIQSGLKVFKKEAVKHLTFDTSKWSFDLEFLYKASHAGYSIIGHPIRYGSRKHGIDKMGIFQGTVELLIFSVKYWLSSAQPVYIGKGSMQEMEIGWNKKRFKPYTNLHHKNSAIKTLNENQLFVLIIVAFLIVNLFIINWSIGLVIFITFISFLYFTDVLFNLYLIISSLRKKPGAQISQQTIVERQEWPTYTIMCPLYKEWSVVPQFTKAIENMDYPKDKLQVLLILEEDDTTTQTEIRKMQLPSYFEILVTPHNFPKTKPKACNYALIHSKGEYVVIYDAEDIPDRLQLKKAVLTFESLKDENVVCLQAKLNFYNVKQNLLTVLFTLEYTLWFDLILTGLHSIGAPIPLGGTSNHFKRKYLNLLQGWDPFNVTEDCDLGIRLFKYGYKTHILDSVTLEEANSSFFGWFPQRTRWSKGYIQTYLVHMRNPHEFITDWSNPHLLTFQLVVGGKILSSLINPFLWMMTIAYFLFRSQLAPFIESIYIAPAYYLAVLSLIFGNFLYFYNYMLGAAKKGRWDLVKYAFIVPFYWIMMSVSAWKALHQIILKPHYWDKTKHGLHLKPTLA